MSAVGEFGLIKKLAGGCINDPGGVIEGIGDDSAVLRVAEHTQLLVTSDMLVDGVHFIRGKITPWQLGHKAMAVSLSDIAAMGGKPRHALVSIAIPPAITVEEIEEIYAGMKAILSRWAVNLVGGDTVKSPVLTIDVTMLGEAGNSILRSGARPGDQVLVTGTPGDSAAGLEILLAPGAWSEELLPADRDLLLSAHLTPEPALAQSALLGKLGCVTAMIDVSDGLASEINHICDRSGTGAEIFADQVPFSAPAVRAASLCGKDPLEWALCGGEDYDLLFTVPPHQARRVMKSFARADLGPVTVIGAIKEQSSGQILVLPAGNKVSLDPAGFNHFKENG